MKHIHFVIYRLKSIIFYFLFIYIYSEIEFINKRTNSKIIKIFIYYYSYIYIFYFVSQVLCICTDNRGVFSIRNIFFIVIILSFLYLIIWWGIGIASESKLEVLKDGWFGHNNCFHFFLLFYLIILFYYCSNIPYSRE
jgi:hypothetical protein